MAQQPAIPIDVVHLLPVLHDKLIRLLQSFTPADWEKQTVARLWNVKDVAAHLLDGNIRVLSMLRDNHYGEQADINTHQDLVDFLNRLNADWVKAMKRVSPQMLILLHEVTGPLYCSYYQSLDPFDKAGFAVAWAGEQESKNWMHIAREFTEKFLHQQQIREATNRPGLMTREFYHPFIDIFMRALPHTYRAVDAASGTTVKVTVTTDMGGSWFLTRTNSRWTLTKEAVQVPAAEVVLDPDTSWKLFSKSLRPEQVQDKVRLQGDEQLGAVALTMVSVMA